MNAVKRCLALFAATLVVGACSGDPTADEAGANLTIRATPGAVWVRHDRTATVLLEAIDGTGGTQPGSWTVSTIVGPIVATLDTGFQNTNSGPLGNARQFIISSTAEGEGFVVFSGTGGVDTVRVRIAPAPDSFNVVFSSLSPAIAEVITVTAPAGIRFTAGTTVGFVSGALNTANNGLAAPSITAMSADSTQLSVLPAPGAAGRMSITGIASISTPTLISSAVSKDSVTVPVLSNVVAVLSSTTPALNAPLTITMPVNFKFRPTSAFSIAGQTFAPVVISRSADSNSVVILPSPGATGAISITNVRFAPIGGLSLTLPTSLSVTVGANANIGVDDPANVANPSFAAPTVIGTRTGWYDLATMTEADPTCDGGVKAQYYTVTTTTAGSFTFTTNWTVGTDVDVGVMVKDGSYGSPSCADYLATTGLSGAKPEVTTVTLAAGTTYTLIVIDYTGTTTGATQVQVQVLKN